MLSSSVKKIVFCILKSTDHKCGRRTERKCKDCRKSLNPSLCVVSMIHQEPQNSSLTSRLTTLQEDVGKSPVRKRSVAAFCYAQCVPASFRTGKEEFWFSPCFLHASRVWSFLFVFFRSPQSLSKNNKLSRSLPHRIILFPTSFLHFSVSICYCYFCYYRSVFI